MSYATAEQFRARLGNAIHDEIYPSAPPAADDLSAAAAEIDGAIARRYQLPVTGEHTLALLRDWNLTLAEERAYARAAGSQFADKVKLRVEQVRKYLNLIRADQFTLPDAAEKSGTSGGVALAHCDAPVFGRDKMKGF